jgi:D-alanyl-D-alanine carboxypeptidase
MRQRGVALAALTLVAGITVSSPPSPAVALDNTPWTLPTTPPTCTEAQANSGAVSGCVLYGRSGLPEDEGWPAPPFPDTAPGQAFPPAGWTWNGAGYNGSAALAGWERLMSPNTAAIGGIGAGRLVMMPEALQLFDGFLREIQANGYAVKEGGGYQFRCVSSSGVRNCEGLTRAKLSNHAYGLAIDFNSAANPVRTYSGIGGASACQTPMVTDMPRWVVQTAEKWGLYWGGYGWSSGCTSPAQVKASANRDPTHYEFRGTPAQARAVLAANGRTPTFCVPSVDTAGTAGSTCLYPGQSPPAGTRLMVQTNAPAGAASALVNVTALGAAANGAITAEPCGPAAPRDTVNNLISANRTLGNVAVVPLDAAGRFCLYLSTAAHAVVDLQGYFMPAAAAPDGLTFTPYTGGRLVDTRTDRYCRADGTCASGVVPTWAEVQLDVPGAPAGAVATFTNLVMTLPSGRGYLTANRCDELTPGPQQTSNLNPMPGLVASNLGIVRSELNGGASRLCSTSSVSGYLVVDAQGFFAPPTSGGLALDNSAAQRVLDTSGCVTDPLTAAQTCGQQIAAGGVVRLRAPAGSSAVVVNLSTWGAVGRGGYITAKPCASLQPGEQATANSNYSPGTLSSNLALVPVDSNGLVCFYSSAAVHLAVDLQATFSATGTLRYVPSAATRLLDTRPG